GHRCRARRVPAGRAHRIRRRRGQLVGASRSVRHSGRDRRGGTGGARHSDEAGVQHSGRGPGGVRHHQRPGGRQSDAHHPGLRRGRRRDTQWICHTRHSARHKSSRLRRADSARGQPADRRDARKLRRDGDARGSDVDGGGYHQARGRGPGRERPAGYGAGRLGVARSHRGRRGEHGRAHGARDSGPGRPDHRGGHEVAGTSRVVRYSVSADPDLADLGSAQTILSVSHPTYANHNGVMVTFGPDGYLYFGTGDGGSPGDVAGNAQDSTRLLGKILRIDVSGGAPYTLPPTNPFIGRSAAPEVWAYGLRNPYRFSFDPQTGDLYLPDVGEDAWEEVNVQPSTSGGGENYGWSVMEGAHCFRPPSGCATAGLVVPVFEYAHGPADVNGCAIIGGYLYRGTRLPALAGRYFFGDLCAGWVKSFRLQNGSATDLVDYTSQLGLHPGLTSEQWR